jgi:hypothetical protein
MEFGEYVNGLAGLSFAGAAAALSSTLLKSQLLPEQLDWLGAAGTVVAACMIAISFTFRSALQNQALKIALAVVLVVTCSFVIWLRASRVVKAQSGGSASAFLIGWNLTPFGLTARDNQCKVASERELIECSGAQTIPSLYGDSYRHAVDLYIGSYLLLLAVFVPLIAALELQDTQRGHRLPQSPDNI